MSNTGGQKDQKQLQSALPLQMKIYSGAINIKNIYNVNLLTDNKNASNLNENKKKEDQKEDKIKEENKDKLLNLKSHIYDTRKEIYLKTEVKEANLKITEEKTFLSKKRTRKEEGNKSPFKKIPLKFNEKTSKQSAEKRKSTNFIQNITNKQNISKIESFQTPKNKIRNQNTITDLTVYNFNAKFFSTSPKKKLYINNSNSSSNKEENNIVNNFGRSIKNLIISGTIFDLEFINNLLSKEYYYRPDPQYILKHPRLQVIYRSILVEWTMELCEEFAFKRDTFHYAINYIDRFLSKFNDISKRSLQLLGVASLSIAAKCEEIQVPKIMDYINSADHPYTPEEFMATERQILKTLKWEIMPTTINTWLNWYILQWDLYIETYPEIKYKILQIGKDVIFFKKTEEKSYNFYRKITQLIDIYTVDYYSLNYPPRYLVSASMFIIFGAAMDFSPFLSINAHKFDYDFKFFSDILRCDKREGNFIFEFPNQKLIIEVFSDFLYKSFGFVLGDEHFINTLVYCIKFLPFEFRYDLPLAIQNNPDEVDNVSLLYFYMKNYLII